MHKRQFLKRSLAVAGGSLLGGSAATRTPVHSTVYGPPGAVLPQGLPPSSAFADPVPFTGYPDFGDLNKHCFSAAGSRLLIGYRSSAAREGLRIKTLRHRAVTFKWDDVWAGDYYDVELLAGGESLPYRIEQSPWRLRLVAEGGGADIAFSGEDTLYFSTEGVGLRLLPLQPYRWIDPRSPSLSVMLAAGARTFHYFLAEESAPLAYRTVRDDDPEEAVKSARLVSVDAAPGASFALRETAFEEVWEAPLPSPSAVHASAKRRVDDWMARMPAVPADYREALQTAWFYLDNYLVAPSEFVTRRALLCSKNSWLTKVWAWDHCFHGLALALGDPELGWDQIKLFFDNQLPNGGLPEPLSDLMRQTGFVKPPVHGWAIGQLMRRQGREVAIDHVRELYEPLGRFTEFWFEFYGGREHGLCYYRHGNDSGWDNATAFDQGLPTQGADLAAYLVLQLETLAEMAEWLGRSAEAHRWRERSEAHLALLLERCVVDGRFVSPLVATGRAEPCASLINYMPVLLGRRLPREISARLVADLSPGGPFLTAHGYSTEALDSPKRELDGYWRGAIWAPPTYHIFLGLLDLGEVELARETAHRFLRTVALSSVMAENYEATTGEPLQAPGVSWTSAVAVLLGAWLAEDGG